MERLTTDQLAEQPSQLGPYFGNGGAEIVNRDGRVVAEVPPAIDPAPIETDLTFDDSDWLDQ